MLLTQRLKITVSQKLVRNAQNASNMMSAKYHEFRMICNRIMSLQISGRSYAHL